MKEQNISASTISYFIVTAWSEHLNNQSTPGCTSLLGNAPTDTDKVNPTDSPNIGYTYWKVFKCLLFPLVKDGFKLSGLKSSPKTSQQIETNLENYEKQLDAETLRSFDAWLKSPAVSIAEEEDEEEDEVSTNPAKKLKVSVMSEDEDSDDVCMVIGPE